MTGIGHSIEGRQASFVTIDLDVGWSLAVAIDDDQGQVSRRLL